MRLDHLLSKETRRIEIYVVILCSEQSLSLFNFWGSEMNARSRLRPYGGVAHLGERLPCKQEVTGSIPVISTMSRRTGIKRTLKTE